MISQHWSQCWPILMSPYDVIRPQWCSVFVNVNTLELGIHNIVMNMCNKVLIFVSLICIFHGIWYIFTSNEFHWSPKFVDGFPWWQTPPHPPHYNDVIMIAMASQITCVSIVLLNCLSRRRSKKASKLRVPGFYEGNSPVTAEFPHKRPVTQKMFPFDDVIMTICVEIRWQLRKINNA